MRTGGDIARSFVTIQNNGADELDLSLWKIINNTKTFVLPKNTILGVRKSITLASEVTGLATPVGSNPELLFSNGTRVEAKVEKSSPPLLTPITTEKPKVKAVTKALLVSQAPQRQEASILKNISETPPTFTKPPTKEPLWPWYIGAAFLAALALVGFRFTQATAPQTTFSADDFEILEEKEGNEPH